jgi:hypothetical protein
MLDKLCGLSNLSTKNTQEASQSNNRKVLTASEPSSLATNNQSRKVVVQ